jgi:hypothetical protein
MQLMTAKGRTAHWMQHNKMEIYRTQKLVALCILTTIHYIPMIFILGDVLLLVINRTIRLYLNPV